MSFWGWMRQAGLILVGRNANGTNPRSGSEYQAVAIDQSSRELMGLAQIRLRDIVGAVDVDAAADPQGRPMVLVWGRDLSSVAQAMLLDANRALVMSRPGAISPPSMLASVHLSNVANTLIFSSPASQVFLVERIILTNNNTAVNDVTISRSTAGNASRIFRGTVAAGTTTVFEGPIYVPAGKPLRGSTNLGGLTVAVEGYRVR